MNYEAEITNLCECIVKQSETMGVLIAAIQAQARRIEALEFAALPIATRPQ